MKRIIKILLAACLIFSLFAAVACVKDEKTEYTVTLTAGNGYSYTDEAGAAISGTAQIAAGQDFKFTVAVAQTHEGTPVVKAGSETLTAAGGVYTHNVTGNVTITVIGITEITATNYTVTLTTGSGYTYTNEAGTAISGTAQIAAGQDFKFKVVVAATHEGTPEVMAGSETLTATDGVYTHNVAGNVTITVTGITEIVEEEDEIYFFTFFHVEDGDRTETDEYAGNVKDGFTLTVTEGDTFAVTIFTEEPGPIAEDFGVWYWFEIAESNLTTLTGDDFFINSLVWCDTDIKFVRIPDGETGTLTIEFWHIYEMGENGKPADGQYTVITTLTVTVTAK